MTARDPGSRTSPVMTSRQAGQPPIHLQTPASGVPPATPSASGSPDNDRQEILTINRAHSAAAQLRALADALDDANSLIRVTILRELQLRAAEELQSAVGQARDEGATWQQVADAAGMSRAAAHQRWRNRDLPHASAAPDRRPRADVAPMRRERVNIQIGPVPIPLTLTISRRELPVEGPRRQDAPNGRPTEPPRSAAANER